MPWYFPWSEAIKKRACRYLLQHYLGRFLETKLGLDQLSVDLYKGTGCVKDVNLDVEALNDLSDEQGFPVEFLDGSIAEVSVSVPWSALLSDSSFVEIKGLCLVVNPKQQCKNAFMWESMINSMIMTTSMQLAEECLKQNEGEPLDESQNSFEGLELFAQTLETVLSRIKVRFLDTVIRLEYVPQSSLSGVGIEIHIKRVDYYDMAGQDQSIPKGDQIVNEKSAYATKKFRLEGVSIYSDEFAANEKTQSRSYCTSSESASSSDSFSESNQSNKTQEQIKISDTPILCGKLSGRHEIAVRYKQCDTLPGPKMELDVTLGSTLVFLSPRQLHSFHAIFQALLLPTYEINIKSKRTEKPMQLSDYRRIENELQQQIKQATISNVPGESLSRKGWSTGYLGMNDDSDDEFHAFEPSSPEKIDVCMASNHLRPSTGAALCENNGRNDSPSAHNYKANNRAFHNLPENGCSATEENAAVRMRFSVKLGSLAALLLHEDILTCSSTTGQLAASSVEQMRSLANIFFGQLGLFNLTGAGIKDLTAAKEKLDAACSKSHLRIILAPVSIAGTEQDSAAGTTLELNLTVAAADVLECLLEKNPSVPNSGIDYSSIINFFPNVDGCIQPKPNLQLKFISHQPGRILQKVRNPSKPEMHINICLSPCEVEIDMSIVDRITALLNRPNFLNSPKAKFNQMYQEKHPSVDAMLDNHSLCQTLFSVSSPKINVKLRFPIPDLRPVHDMQRNPWWRRCLRPDILSFALYEVVLNTTFIPNETTTTFHLVCKEALGSYQEKAGQEILNFLQATAQDGDDVDIADGAGHYDLPRITFTLRPSQTNGIELEDHDDTNHENEEDTDIMTMSTGEALLGITSSQPSPFSKQRRIHKGHNHRDEGSTLDELLVPGNSEEIAEFMAVASKMCLTQIDISIPKATILLPSKQFFETIYNRLSTDLCLWEPSAPEYLASHGNPFHEAQNMSSFGGLSSAVLQSPIPNMFIMCKSGVAYESDSESDEGESGTFTYMKNRQEQWNIKKGAKSSPSKMCVSVNIGKGSGTLFCQLKDSFGNDSVTHHGEVQCTVEDGKLFSVTAFKGDAQTGYVCFQASKTSLSHNGYVLNSYDDVANRPSSKIHQTSRVDPVIYPSSNDTKVGREQLENGAMLSLALKIHNDTRQYVKTFKTAISLQGGTLRHRFGVPAQSWFNQLIDFFDVVDYPIAGYHTPTIITELHLNLSNCGIDYRPLYLPARAFLSLGTLNISSNIMAQTNSSVLRFVMEDVALYLSNRVSYGTVNLRRDYVCVLDIDLIELSLRLREKQQPTEISSKNKIEIGEITSPLFELQASLNLVRLRTCADSCRLLLDLITYLADDGDFDEKGTAMSEDSSESGLMRSGLNSAVGGSLSSLHGQEVEAQVNDLMAEAMQDSSPVQHQRQQKVSSNEELVPNTTEVFFFPDENRTSIKKQNVISDQSEPCGVWHQEIDQQLMDDALDPACDDCPKSEEEFCILENDPGIGFTPRGGEPQIRQLTSDPVQVVEGHFAPPIGKTDVLKAPKSFPVPVMRYTLGEMTLIWEVFGGQDFPKSSPTSFSSSSNKNKFHRTVTFSKDSLEQVKIRPSAENKSPSHFVGNSISGGGGRRYQNHTGGCNRQQDVKLELQMNKVRFIHEVYPEDTFQASRQVLTIGDIEIRDRLAESHINKFLYQYCCEARPRQAHANMVLIKALHVRPDLHLPALECCLKVSILPLRLHIDQDTLTFMSEFSSALSEAGCHSEDEEGGKSTMNTPISVPVMGVAGEVISPTTCSRDFPNQPDSISSADSSDLAVSPPIYFRSFVFSPDVLIRFDYHGKGVDLSQGPSFSGLLVGLGQLNCSQLTLKRLSHRHGLLGAHKLIAYALNEWLMDIKKNQLPSVMAGVGPMHSIVQLVQGIRDLFWLPIEQFQKDGRIVRGLQRGANAFSTSAALAILELTSRLVQTLQSAAETAYDVVSPGPSVRRTRTGSRGRRRRQVQPVDIRDGVAKAYQVVREGLGETAQTLVRVANEEAEQKGMTGAVGGVLRQIPPIVVKPIILATEATFNVIGGVQSQLMPDTRKEASDKWRQDD